VTAFDGKRQSRFGGCLGDKGEAAVEEMEAPVAL
jgi:hypothetical protein